MRNQDAFITVVSGLPRSGTSMMMQVLEAGGIAALTDGSRGADQDNPRGYYELDAARQIASDASFLNEAHGKALKLIHALVTKLPTGYHYRVLFLRRPIGQVLASQQKMLAHSGRRGAALAPEKLGPVFEKQVNETLALLSARSDVALFEVDYPQLVLAPAVAMADINAFLGGELNVDAMQHAVRHDLFRNR